MASSLSILLPSIRFVFQYHFFDYPSFECFLIIFASFFSIIIAIKSSLLISLFLNTSYILLSVLLSLLLANITILLCFLFLYRVVFNSIFTIPVKIENARLKLPLIIPTGALITVANDAIEILPVKAIKAIKQIKQLMTYQNSQKKQCIYHSFCPLILFLSSLQLNNP